jgi:hypothetical protein
MPKDTVRFSISMQRHILERIDEQASKWATSWQPSNRSAAISRIFLEWEECQRQAPPPAAAQGPARMENSYGQ